MRPCCLLHAADRDIRIDMRRIRDEDIWWVGLLEFV